MIRTTRRRPNSGARGPSCLRRGDRTGHQHVADFHLKGPTRTLWPRRRPADSDGAAASRSGQRGQRPWAEAWACTRSRLGASDWPDAGGRGRGGGTVERRRRPNLNTGRRAGSHEGTHDLDQGTEGHNGPDARQERPAQSRLGQTPSTRLNGGSRCGAHIAKGPSTPARHKHKLVRACELVLVCARARACV